MYTKSIYLFRRDLRLEDNTGLIECVNNSKQVVPVFIFTPEQIITNPYKSDASIQFMIESLEDLSENIKKKSGKIYFIFDDTKKAITKLLNNNKDIEAIYYNKDWTPYAKKRDKIIEQICKNSNIDCHEIEDYTLTKMGTILTNTESVYQVFTPFHKNAKTKSVEQPQNISNYKFSKMKQTSINLSELNKYYQKNDNVIVTGGRNAGLKILNKVKNQTKYNQKRNDLTYTTTLLSAYIKFGCVSIREVYYKFKILGSKTDLLKQLYWREFYMYIAHYMPKVLKGYSMKEKYDKIKWKGITSLFKKWCEGTTGFPIVDAGMKQLNQTGYMHNRSRLITSGFLIKLALIDWRKGEKYFATKLVDYDPMVNNGNWQWSSGSGADAQPYFRILSPISQGKRFDPNAEYIKYWLPQLKDIPAKHLLDWEKYHNEYDTKKINYVKPCLNYKEQRKNAIKMYKKYI